MPHRRNPGLRILSIPGRGHENRYFRLMLEGMEASGADIVDPHLARVATFGYDVLCLNFPTHHITESGPAKALLLSAVFGTYLLLARLLGRKIVYIVHDVRPLKVRNGFVLWRFLALVRALTQGYVFISKSSSRAFMAAYSGQRHKPHVLIPHGPYPTTALSFEQRAALRRSLVGEEDVFLLGFLGNIKPYKNVAALRTLPAVLPDGRKVRTLIAGRIEKGYEREIQAVLDELDPDRIIRLDQALTDAELDGLIQAVDVVLMPYLRGSNSGVALLVLANGGRLIGSDLPILRELAADVGAPWVTIAGSEQTWPEAVRHAASRSVDGADRQMLRAYLDRIGFAAGARALYAFCRRLQHASGRTAVRHAPWNS